MNSKVFITYIKRYSPGKIFCSLTDMRMCSIDLHYILTFTKTNRLSANRNPRNSLTMASQRKYPLSDLRKMATFYLAFTQAFINVGIVLCVNAIAWRV